jgi:competence protein ComEC
MEEVIAAPGMRITVGDGVVLEVLYSDRGLDDDPASPGEPVVLMVSYGNLRVLLPGDLSEEAEMVLMSTGQPIDATVLHVPRGGHRSSSSEGFLTAVSPEIGIISPLSNDLPHAETVERLEAAGSAIYRLDQVGRVRLTSDGQQMWIAVDHE